LEIEQRDEITILRPQGAELGTEEAEEFRSTALNAIPATNACVAIDMSSIIFMDSSGLSALIAAMKRTRSGGGELVLFGIRPAVREILNLTRLDGVFAVCDSEESSIAFLRRADDQEKQSCCG
jgi:anti-sigma B factor antagonist